MRVLDLGDKMVKAVMEYENEKNKLTLWRSEDDDYVLVNMDKEKLTESSGLLCLNQEHGEFIFNTTMSQLRNGGVAHA